MEKSEREGLAKGGPPRHVVLVQGRGESECEELVERGLVICRHCVRSNGEE